MNGSIYWYSILMEYICQVNNKKIILFVTYVNKTAGILNIADVADFRDGGDHQRALIDPVTYIHNDFIRISMLALFLHENTCRQYRAERGDFPLCSHHSSLWTILSDAVSAQKDTSCGMCLFVEFVPISFLQSDPIQPFLRCNRF